MKRLILALLFHTEIMGGAGFRMSDNVTSKAQYQSIRKDRNKTPMVKLIFIVSADTSVYF